MKDYLCDAVIKQMGSKSSPVWIAVYQQYKDAIVAVFTQTVAEVNSNGVLQHSSPDVCTTYTTCAEKFVFILNFQSPPDHLSYWPLMSASVWNSLAKHFKYICHSLIEVHFIICWSIAQLLVTMRYFAEHSLSNLVVVQPSSVLAMVIRQTMVDSIHDS